MQYKKIVLSIIASVLCLGILSGCGHKNEISIKIETYLQEEYGEELKYCLGINRDGYHQTMVQSMQLVFQKKTQSIHLRVAILIPKNQTQK